MVVSSLIWVQRSLFCFLCTCMLHSFLIPVCQSFIYVSPSDLLTWASLIFFEPPWTTLWLYIIDHFLLSGACILHRNDSHDLISKLCEESSTCTWFCHVLVSNHVPRGTPFHHEVLLADPICYKKIVPGDIDMVHALAAQGFAVLLHKNCTIITVLVNNIFLNPVTFYFHKIPGA